MVSKSSVKKNICLFFCYLLIGLSLLIDVAACANQPATSNCIQTNNPQPYDALPKKKIQKNIYATFQSAYKRFRQKLRGVVKRKAKRIALATSAAISATGVALFRFFSRAPAAVPVQAGVYGAASEENEEKEESSMDTELHLAVREKRNDHLVQLLLNKKASVHAKGNNGNLPLHCAMRAECYANIRLLLQHKTNINIQNDRGLTPLHLATPIYTDAKIASLLLDAMPQLEVTNNNGLTALQLAINSNNQLLTQRLIIGGAKTDYIHVYNTHLWEKRDLPLIIKTAQNVKMRLDELNVIYDILSNVLADSIADIKNRENIKSYSPLLPPFIAGITCAYLLPCEKLDQTFSPEIMILAQEEIRRKGAINGENSPEFYIKAAMNNLE